MSLPSLFKDSDKDPTLFLAVFLTNSTVRSVLWKNATDHPTVLETSSTHTYTDQKSLLVSTDETLQELGANSEKTDQVIFVLENNWVKESGILDDKKPILKKITTELSLKAMGFVVSSDSVIQHLQTTNPQVSALLLGVTRTHITLTLVKNGRKQADQIVGKSGDTVADLIEALARLTQQQPEEKVSFPGKVVLYSVDLTAEELQNEQQEMLKSNWHEAHNFIQPPVVDKIKPTQLIKSIIKNSANSIAKPEIPKVVGAPPPKESPPQPEKKPATVQPKKESFGFKELAVDPSVMVKNHPRAAQQSNKQPMIQPKKKRPRKPGKIPFVIDFVQHHIKLVSAGFVAGLVAIVIIFIAVLPKFAQTNVELILSHQVLSQDVKITLSPNIDQADAQNLLLPAKTQEKEVSSKRTNPSTGVKLIGDPATGEVEIFNKTSEEITLNAGSTLSIEEKEYLTDQEVTVTAAETNPSEDGSGETKVYGKSKVNVKAAEIGEEGNIDAGKNGTIAGYADSDLSATTVSGLSGGSSREVQIVSQKDRTSILEELKEELIKIAIQEYQQESNDDTYFIPTGNNDVSSYNFDAEVGDEINTLTLELTMSVEAHSYSNQDLKLLAEVVISQDLPPNYIFDEESFQILSDAITREDGVRLVVLQANISAKAIPDMDSPSIIQEIGGLEIDQAQALLQNKDEIKSATIKISPSFLRGLVKTLPKDPNRITILVE